MKNIFKTIPVLLIAVFLGYWYGSDNKISDRDFGQFGLEANLPKFAYINSFSSDEIDYFLHRDPETKGKFGPFLNEIMRIHHCTLSKNMKCEQFTFLEIAKSFKIFIDLDLTPEQLEAEKISMTGLQDRYSWLFNKFLPLKLPHFTPRFYFVSNRENANIVINIQHPLEPFEKLDNVSSGCDIKLDTRRNVIVGANLTIAIADMSVESGGLCELNFIYAFYNMSGVLYASAALSDQQTKINAALTREYYRWLHIHNNFPINNTDLLNKTEEFIKFVKSM